MQRAESEANDLMKNRREAAKGQRDAKTEKDQANKYKNARDALADAKSNFYLAKIYSFERACGNAEDEKTDVQKQIDTLRQRKTENNSRLTSKSKVSRSCFRERAKIEEKISDEVSFN